MHDSFMFIIMGKDEKASLTYILHRIPLLLIFALIVHGHREFMNIDCGKPRDYHGTDSLTDLVYVSDYDYIETGVTHSIDSTFQGPNVSTQANDLRSFPNGTRNCYSLTPVSPGRKYLIRASFLHGNYDGNVSFPEFDLYLGTIYWETIAISSSTIEYGTTIYSVASSDYMFVCLINTGFGTPFLSSLELRPLNDYVYSQINATNSVSFVSVDLINFGASTDPVVRYPDDVYDRVWSSYGELGWTKLFTTSDVDTSGNFFPPSLVMQTAVAPTSGSTWNFSITLKKSSPFSHYYAFMNFAEIQQLNNNDSRIFAISWNGHGNYSLQPKYLNPTTIYTVIPNEISWNGYENKLNFSLYMTNGSTLPPIINALEIYEVRTTEQVHTKSEDAEAIRAIKEVYHIRRYWTGDPCVPRTYAWDGLVCSYDGSPRITSLNLRASGLTGSLSVSISYLTELQVLDLSTNKLKGSIPSFLGKLDKLISLNLTNSGLKGPIPKVLLERSRDGSLEISFDDKYRNSPRDHIVTPSGEGDKKRTVLIIGIVVSFVIVLLVLISLGILWIFKRQKHNKQQRGLESQNIQVQPSSDHFSPNSSTSDCRQFTYSELVKITNHFIKMVGEGGFGSVYYGILSNKIPVAVKMLSTESRQGQKEFQREVQVLTTIHHKHLVPFIGYCNDKHHLALVYEYMTQGDLKSHLSGEAHPLSWGQRLRIATQAAEGFEYLHKYCTFTIIHRDIKPSNILLDQNLEVKIGDFGLSRACNNDHFNQVTTGILGTCGYLDPFMTVPDQRSDVYAFGVVLLELITGQPAIIRRAGGICLTEWVKEQYKRGELNSAIVDNRLQGYYNSNAVRKALETALACVSPNTDGRPDMTRVLVLLKECLTMESVDSTSSTNSKPISSEFFNPGTESTAIGPSAR